jgi:hypothetical protein
VRMFNPVRTFASPRGTGRTLTAVGTAGLVAGLVAVLPAPALAARSCGSVHGVTIQAVGVSCTAARTVYSKDQSGHPVHGWVCSAAEQACGKGRLGSGERVLWSTHQSQGQGQGQ